MNTNFRQTITGNTSNYAYPSIKFCHYKKLLHAKPIIYKQLFRNIIQLNLILSLSINLSQLINHMSWKHKHKHKTMCLMCTLYIRSRILNAFAFCQVDKKDTAPRISHILIHILCEHRTYQWQLNYLNSNLCITATIHHSEWNQKQYRCIRLASETDYTRPTNVKVRSIFRFYQRSKFQTESQVHSVGGRRVFSFKKRGFLSQGFRRKSRLEIVV